jgi:aminoglycoside phosphotransferase (APT) family kinase protein
MRALSGHAEIAVPRIYFEDLGMPPDVPPLFGMEMVPGEAFEPNKDPRAGSAMPAPRELAARAEAATRMLAVLHNVDPQALGLTPEPAISLPEELRRWHRALERADSTFAVLGSAVCAELAKMQPDPVPPRVCHGDFRLGNTLCEHGRVLAIIDWEIWSLSDPRLDVAWLLLTADADAHPLAIRQAAGMPTAEELLRVYESESGGRLDHLPWFRALALLKMAAAVALIVKHQTRRGDSQNLAERLAPQIPVMLNRAQAAVRKLQESGEP